MNFAQNDSQQMIAETIRRLLQNENEFEVRRQRLAGDKPDRTALWPQISELGILGVFIPESAGGYGGTARDAAVIMYDIGRSLTVEPCLSVLMASRVLLALEEDTAQGMIEELIDGSQIPSVIQGHGFDPLKMAAITAVEQNGSYLLNGTQAIVRHADIADYFLIFGTLSGEAACFSISSKADGVHIESFRNIDASSGGTVSFNNAPATLLLTENKAIETAQDVVEWGILGMAAEAVGIMDALNEATAEYLRVREQFGMPIGRFQALQHKAADMYIAAQEVAVTTDSLVNIFDQGSSIARSAWTSALKITLDRNGDKVSHDAVQLHGGMGVSDELNVSHFMRRLAAMRAELGGKDFHSDLFSELTRKTLRPPINETDEMANFRQEVRDFVNANLPPELAEKVHKGMHLEKDDYVSWERILRAKGWLAAAWPKEFGGAGWDLQKQLVFVQEAALNNAPEVLPYGVNMVGPVLQNFGNPEQKQQYLPEILESKTWWCQGYSEPNAGSDLASLKTFAELDGDHYIVNGTKMWTTEGHWADMMHCLVRTRKEGKKQEGITFLLIDMNSPGISIQPILTLDGQHHTNQTFFDDVRVPVKNTVGEEGQGWTIAKFLLNNERIAIADTGAKLRLMIKIKEMYAALEKREDVPSSLKDNLGARLTDLDTQLWVLTTMEQRYITDWNDGASRNGPEASLLKIRGTEILQHLAILALDIEGPWAVVHNPKHLHNTPEDNFRPSEMTEQASLMAHVYLYSRCWSVFGGTNEIQRNIIANMIGVA